MTDTFEKALKFTLQWEGGYVNNPNDSGGPTNKGITQKTYDDYRVRHGLARRPVKELTDSEVRDIYYTEYWYPTCTDRWDQDLKDSKLAISIFDFAVHSGVARARKILVGCKSATEYINKRETLLKSIGVGKNATFLKGWLNRINALRKYLEEV